VAPTRLEDGPVEKPLGLRGGEEGADQHAPGGFPEEGDVLGVAAEIANIPLHKAEGLHQVQKPIVPHRLGILLGQGR